jgi:hypothetical protein
VVAAQAEVGKKTSEVPMAAVVLDQIDLEGKIVTADAPHTVKATANLIRERGGGFVLPAKENRRTLFDAATPCRGARPRSPTPPPQRPRPDHHPHYPVLPAPVNLPFPHVRQVFLIERHVTGLKGEPVSSVAALGVASRNPSRQAPPTWPDASGTVKLTALSHFRW